MMMMMTMMTACMRRGLYNTLLSGTLPPSVGNLRKLSSMCGRLLSFAVTVCGVLLVFDGFTTYIRVHRTCAYYARCFC